MLNPNFAAVVNYFTFNESARYLFAITVVEAVDAVLVFPFAVYVIAVTTTNGLTRYRP